MIWKMCLDLMILPIDTKELLDLGPKELSDAIVLMNEMKKRAGHFLVESISNLDFKLELADDLLGRMLHEAKEIEEAEAEARREAEESAYDKDVREELIEKINSFSTDRIKEILDSVENND